jgi:peptide/nickel transport system permease protein
MSKHDAQSIELKQMPKGRAPWKIILRRLVRNRSAIIGGVILAVLYLAMILGRFISPYDPAKQDLMNFYHPPTRLHFVDESGKFHLRPFVYKYDLTNLDYMIYTPDKTKRYFVNLFTRGERYSFWGLFETDIHLFGVDGPAKIYLLGTDGLGRDVFSRLLYAAKISLSVGLFGIFISLTLAMIIGGISGYFAGAIDVGLMRLIELILSIPFLYLIIALRATFPTELSSSQTYLLIVIIMGFILWAGPSRVIRGMVLAHRDQDFVLAARALGASHLRLIVKHILPNTLSYVIVAATILVPYYILGEVGLSFLGVGIQEPDASWGNMLYQAQDVKVLTSFPWILAPGVAIFITVFAFNFLGDGMRDAVDPRQKI